MNGKVERALAIGEKYGVVRRAEPRETLVAMGRMCAVYGRPWMALYTPKADGHYKLKECVRVDGALGARGGTVKDIPIDLIDGRWLHSEKCPWCGAGEVIHCGNCDGFVCNGRVKGNAFRCYDACGFSGVLSGSYSSFKGVTQPSPVARRAPEAQMGRAAVPVVNRLLLTSGRK